MSLKKADSSRVGVYGYEIIVTPEKVMTTDRMNELMVAVTVGKRFETKNSEEADFVKRIKVDIDMVKESGGQIDIPSDF